MIVSASDTVMTGGIKFELDDTTLVALVAGMVAGGFMADGGTSSGIVSGSYVNFVNAARAIVAEARKMPKEDNP